MSDYFAIGRSMVAHIRQSMSDLRQVRLASSLQEIADWQPASPAVWVVWDSDTVGASAQQGTRQQIKQRWVVALIVRSAKDAASGGGVIESAGPLLDTLLKSLMGWKPGDTSTPLLRVGAPPPGYGAGYGFFPLAFETQIVIST